MRYEDFFAEARSRNLRIEVGDADEPNLPRLENEALFQLPLLAMVILTLSKGKSKPTVEGIGQLVGECLERTVPGFNGSSQSIGWSANLRIRTIRALWFLERKGLTVVNPYQKSISVTELGRSVFIAAMQHDTPLALTLALIERSFENVRAERGIMEEVE